MPSREQIEQAHADARWLAEREERREALVAEGRRTLGHPEPVPSYDWKNFGSRRNTDDR